MNQEQDFRINHLFDVKGLTALVTGGSRGIGLMIAKAFVQNGIKVYISSRKAEVCHAVARELSKAGDCVALPADLSTSEGREKLIAGIMQSENHLDILVNNAGATWGSTLESFPEQGFDKVFNINVKSIFFLTRDLVSLLTSRERVLTPSRVINIGSIEGMMVPNHGTFSYSASKAAVHHLTRVLAVELGPQGIAVNAIAPGPFESKMTVQLLRESQDILEKNTPLKRIGNEMDMAGLALFMVSPSASYLNGAVIPLDGGLHLKTQLG